MIPKAMQNTDVSSLTPLLRRAVSNWIVSRPAPAGSEMPPGEFFQSSIAQSIKQEILAAGRKLWGRQYVDGNGGNISVRVSPDLVICTPTLCSKGDLRLEDLSLVDLENRQICGTCPQTSEIRLHLQIYKAVPEARAVIHCHPPYATAHAIAGIAPPGNLVPEQEVFVGQVAVAPYETPGTLAFAQTILPFVRDHNTILLSNHGIVCWADTVTHAEWYVEVVENYCKTALIASQLVKPPLPEIPAQKIQDLMAIKKTLGLPDPRIPVEPGADAEQPAYPFQMAGAAPADPELDREIDQLISSFSSQLVGLLKKHA